MANIIFNCDSTLVSIEGPDELARRKGVRGVAELTERAMSGDVSFSEVFRQRFQLLAPSLADIQWLGQQYVEHVIPDAKETVASLRADGHAVYIVSASYRPAILQLARCIGIPALNICAVDLDFSPTGVYRGYDEDNILTTDAGISMVTAEIAKLGPTVYVGDSVRDLDARDSVDAFVGFGGVRKRDRVAQESDLYISDPTLLPVVEFVRTFAQANPRQKTVTQATVA
ncbi:HAD-IB family phosphatase [Candidatus Berkelbacteria bacterium]|nr:HAD-IB family phosphatase [Candidatus Berkelbacteria bacterium]